MSEMNHRGMGWLPDYPDFRDYTMQQDEVSLKHQRLGQGDSIKSMLTKTGVMQAKKKGLPTTVDLREWCPPVEDQGEIGSCTANAGVGIVEYFERRAFSNHIDASRLFLYKVTRNLLHYTGDTGAFLRSAMEALVLFGVPPEEYWPYETDKFEEEPSAFCYAFAQNYQAISYYRLDPPGISRDNLLTQLKTNLAAGLPSMFGFSVYDSYSQASDSGKLPFPTQRENQVGGHAIMAVGYDDKMKIRNANGNGSAVETTGAFLIRNSWGSGWGEDGYGWLPYEYVSQGLADDWWSLLKNEWIDTGEFGL